MFGPYLLTKLLHNCLLLLLGGEEYLRPYSLSSVGFPGEGHVRARSVLGRHYHIKCNTESFLVFIWSVKVVKLAPETHAILYKQFYVSYTIVNLLWVKGLIYMYLLVTIIFVYVKLYGLCGSKYFQFLPMVYVILNWSSQCTKYTISSWKYFIIFINLCSK